MGSSTITIQDVVDIVSTMADLQPQASPTGYDASITLAIANDTINQLLARRFNWKWNSKNAAPFLTNSYQQDYPGNGLSDIGWIENGIWVDINSTTLPKPNDDIESARDLAIASTRGGYQGSAPSRVAWMYNRQLQYGSWPGPNATYTPLRGALTGQNPPMAILDANGNILALIPTSQANGGATGATAPVLAANAAEGSTVTDGTLTWVVCSPNSQGWRLNTLPSASGPVYQVWMKYQQKAPKFTSLAATIDPVPDDYAHQFRLGYKTNCYAYAPSAQIRAQHPQMLAEWLKGMDDAQAEGDREPDAFMLVPATQIVKPLFGLRRNPRDPGRPY